MSPNDLNIPIDKLKDLLIGIKGKVVFPWTDGYDQDKQDFNNAWPVDPLAIVYASCYDDVKYCLLFVKTNTIKFSVRSGGHSLAAYSVCDGIVIDVSGLNNVHVDPVGKIAFVEAGATFEKIFPILEQYNLHMPSGECPTVAVAGFMMGGGYGFTSRTYGMGCDVVTSVTVMLANGKIVMANNSNNRDLYWAIRGGTGGNFGVLLNITYRLVSLGEIYGVKLGWAFNNGTANAARALAYVQNNFIAPGGLPRLGFEFAIVKDTDGIQKVFFCATWTGTEVELDLILAPLIALQGTIKVLRLHEKYFAINEQLLANTPDVPPGSMAFSRSTIIASPLTEAQWSGVLDFFLKAPNKYATVGIECYGGVVNQIAKYDTSFIHRDALMDYFCDAIFTPDSNDRAQNEAWSEAYYEYMKQFGNGHSYQNYPNRKQIDYREAFWGDAYPALLAIKQKFDPENDFKFAQSIGPYNINSDDSTLSITDLNQPIKYETYV